MRFLVSMLSLSPTVLCLVACSREPEAKRPPELEKSPAPACAEAPDATTAPRTSEPGPSTSSSSSSPDEHAGEWSPPVAGLRGRLVARLGKDKNARPQVRFSLELENVSDSAAPIELAWDGLESMLKLAFEDATGKALPLMATGGNSLTGPPYWLYVPVSSAIHFDIAKEAYEYLPDGRALFRPLSFQALELPRERTSPPRVKATFGPSASSTLPKRGWQRILHIPAVSLF